VTDRSPRLGRAHLATAPIITIGCRHSIGASWQRVATGPTTGTNAFAANEMLAYPFVLDAPMTSINKGFWVNGSAPAGNTSLAIYDADFNLRVQSASTAAGTASIPQSVAMACKLGPGLYYLACAHSTAATNEFQRWALLVNTGPVKVLGFWKQAGITVGALPNPATPAAYTSLIVPVFGLITRSNIDA
jgi:hypothetical protein